MRSIREEEGITRSFLVEGSQGLLFQSPST